MSETTTSDAPRPPHYRTVQVGPLWLLMCASCGAYVYEPDTHTRWHQEVPNHTHDPEDLGP